MRSQHQRAHMAVRSHPAAQTTILRHHQVEEITGLCRSTLYAKMRQDPKRPNDFDPSFPHPIRIGKRAVWWVAAEVNEWIQAQIKASRGAGNSPAQPPQASPTAGRGTA